MIANHATRTGPVRRQTLLLLLAAVLMVAAIAVILASQGSDPEGLEVTVGTLDDFPVGSVTPLEVSVRLVRPVPRVGDIATGEVVEVPIFIVHDTEVGLLALYAADPHLGCRVGLASEILSAGVVASEPVVFVNPCHGEQYDMVGGYVSGPAPRGLDRFAVTVSGSTVTVDVEAFAYGPER